MSLVAPRRRSRLALRMVVFAVLTVAAIVTAGAVTSEDTGAPAKAVEAKPAAVVHQLPVTSTVASSELTGNGATRATDARMDTRWEAANAGFPQWIRVDLGTKCLVAGVTISWYRSSGREYTHSIQLSTNGVAWRSFSAGAQARYVRVRVTRCSLAHARAAIRELHVLGWSLRTALLLSGDHDLRFKGVTFAGAGNGYGDASSVIEISGSSHNITFEDCTIMPNGDGAGNGVKIVNVNGGIHDITFNGCHFMTQPRMGFECIDRSSTGGRGYRRIRLVNCTFEPQGSEAISFDDNSGISGDCTISNNVVRGGGAAIDSIWGAGFEINRVHNMRVTGNTFYACRDSVWNLTGPSGDCGWAFSRNTIDSTRVLGGIQMADTANCVTAVNVHGGVFPENTIVGAPPSWNVAYLSGCQNMDWRTTKWLDARGEAYSTPYQIDCSQNRF